jgi:hypothetical protein
MKRNKEMEGQLFFGEETQINQRFIFVEDINEVEHSTGKNEKVFLTMNVYDSLREKFESEEIVLVLHIVDLQRLITNSIEIFKK